VLLKIVERIRTARSGTPAVLWLILVPAVVLPLAGSLALELSEHVVLPAARVAGLGAVFLSAGGALGLLLVVYYGQQRDFEAPAATVAPNVRPSPRRVLRVDDEESIRATAQRILQRHGHDVDVAADGTAALLLLEAMEYDIVLCDLRMPNLSGAELYAELRRRGLARDAQFVVTTGDIADADAQRFLGESQVPVLLKPFELTALLEAVER
jgi:CheY-like chemotaxis protein